MRSKLNNTYAFTLIELLTVIAVIAILGGILIPVASGVIKQARIAASKAQLWQYVTAVEKFKAEYNYYPTIFDGENTYALDGATESREFMESLSGRKTVSGNLTTTGGNLNSIEFHNFPTSENWIDSDGDIVFWQLADRFNNNLLRIKVDGNNDGFIDPNPPTNRDPEKPDQKLRTNVTAWVSEPLNRSSPGYGLWE